MKEVTQPESSAKNTAGQLILQWLTYAFWGWLAFTLSVLFTTTTAHFIENGSVSGFAPYGISAVLVLLPLAAVCDFFYTKQEVSKKTGGSSVIMVLHAVLFALISVGSLIGGVFAIVQMLVGATDNNEASTIAIISTLFTAVLFGLLFVRVLQPTKVSLILKKFFALAMVAVTTIVIVLAVTGPVAFNRATKNDRLISNNLPQIGSAINQHVRDTDELPENLDEINVSGDAEKLLEENLVEYKPSTRAATTTAPTYRYDQGIKVYYYQLCVNYKEASRISSARDYNPPSDRGYSSYVSAYSHPAGEVCYKVKTDDYR